MATKSKPRLGRGLSGLISEPVKVPAVEPKLPAKSPSASKEIPPVGGMSSDGASRLFEIDINSIDRNPFQPRSEFDEAALADLAKSIEQSGLIQPIAVRSVDGRWQLVAGERRLRAAKLAKLERIPALVLEADDRQSAEWAIVENVQRKDLDPIDRADAFRSLVERFGLTQGEIAEQVGVDRSSVANSLRLLELEAPIRDLIRSGSLSAGHGKALLAAPAGESRVACAKKAADEGWSVRQTERWGNEAAQKREAAGTAGKPKDHQPTRALHEELERQLREHLGTRVRIATNASGSKGKISIDFYSLEQFDGLMKRLGFEMRS